MRRLAIGIVVVILLAGAFTAWQFKKNIEEASHQAQISALRNSLAELRGAIAKFHSDRGRYPHSLEELVPNYIRRIPVDPMTGSVSWRVTTEETVAPGDDFAASAAPKSESVVVEVHSSAPGYGDY
jgi:general secretion pathway protein G